ncbi:MAG: FHA domain-containing protein [Myxococcota bacterium]
MELIIFRDAREVGRLRLSEGAFSIGRGLHNTIALDDHSISRRHARLHVRDGHVEVEDLSSINGTWLGGQPVREASLQDGDILTIGPFSLEIWLEEEDVVIHDGLDSTQPGKELGDVATVTRPVGIHSIATDSGAAIGGESDFSMLAEGSDEGVGEHDSMHPHDFLGLHEDDWMEHTLRPQPEKSKPAARPAPEPAARPKLERSKATTKPKSSPDFVFDDEGGPDNNHRPDATRPNPRLPKTVDLASTPKAGRKGSSKTQTPQLSHPDGPRLELREGQALQTIMELARRTLYIGRAEEMDLVLLDSNASRRHAAVHWEDDSVYVKDIWSMNGIKVNGEKVQYAELKPGDRLQIGDTVLEFVWPAAPAPVILPVREAAPEKTAPLADPPTVAITAQQLAAAQAHTHEPHVSPAPVPPVNHPPAPAAPPLSAAASLEPPKSTRSTMPPVAEPPVAAPPVAVPTAKNKAATPASPLAAPSQAAPAISAANIATAPRRPAAPARVGAPVQAPQKTGLSTPAVVVGALLLALAVGAGAAILKKSNAGPTDPQPVAALPGEPPPAQAAPVTAPEVSGAVASAPVLVSSPAEVAAPPVPVAVVVTPVPAPVEPPVVPTPASARTASAPVESKPASAPSLPSAKTSAPIAEPPTRVAMVAAPTPAPAPSKPATLLSATTPPKVERPTTTAPTTTAPTTTAPTTTAPTTAASAASSAAAASSTSSGSRTADVLTSVANSPTSNPVVAKTPSAPSRADVEKRMNASYQSGLVAQKQGRLPEAIKLFEKALAEDPRRESELYYQIEDDIQAARSRLHEQVRPMVTEATALAERGQLAEARQQLQDAVNRAPDYQAAASRLKQVEAELNKQGNKLLAGAESREQAGATSEAETLYKQVLSLVQDKSHPLYQRASQRLDQLKQKK